MLCKALIAQKSNYLTRLKESSLHDGGTLFKYTFNGRRSLPMDLKPICQRVIIPKTKTHCFENSFCYCGEAITQVPLNKNMPYWYPDSKTVRAPGSLFVFSLQTEHTPALLLTLDITSNTKHV